MVLGLLLSGNVYSFGLPKDAASGNKYEKSLPSGFKKHGVKIVNKEATFYKQQRLVHWCNAHDQGNYRSIHSDEYKSKTEKKYEYY